MVISRFDKWNKINEEASPRIPNDINYWLKKGKEGKKVALYTHDDMDGIFCAIEMKKYLLNKGFEIVKYGIINYTDGWKYTTLDPKLINVCLDFANMPGDDRDDLIDFYLDHHGLFSEEDLEKYKSSPVQKKSTASAYEALCQSLGVPQDSLTVDVIRMIDAAKYDEYGVSWKRLLDFNLKEITKSKNKRLEFGAAFNQMLKRGDTKTLVSVIRNCNDASIYSIFNTMKKVYGKHNVNNFGPQKGQAKDFLEDAEFRLRKMEKMTRGSKKNKKVYMSQKDFLADFQRQSSPGAHHTIGSDGYSIIGDLVFVPTATWANALRARTIVMEDYEMGLIMDKINNKVTEGILDKLDIYNTESLKKFLSPEEIYLFSRKVDKSGNVWTIPKLPKFILLQYGSTLQVCAYGSIKEMEGLPKYKNGDDINDLGIYVNGLLKNFQTHLNYYDPNTEIGQDEITVSGGHGGIGSISNVFGVVKDEEVKNENGDIIPTSKIVLNSLGLKYVDMFKNKIISDLSGVPFSISLIWSEKQDYKGSEPEQDYKVIKDKDITKLDGKGNFIDEGFNHKIYRFDRFIKK